MSFRASYEDLRSVDEVECPFCGAARGEKCCRERGPHPERVALMNARRKAEEEAKREAV